MTFDLTGEPPSSSYPLCFHCLSPIGQSLIHSFIHSINRSTILRKGISHCRCNIMIHSSYQTRHRSISCSSTFLDGRRNQLPPFPFVPTDKDKAENINNRDILSEHAGAVQAVCFTIESVCSLWHKARISLVTKARQ